MTWIEKVLNREVKDKEKTNDWMLRWMKEQGALLNSIRPSHLHGEHAWSIVIFQAIRIFLLPKISKHLLKTLPGVLATEHLHVTEAYLASRNDVSSHELILLKWLEFGHDHIFHGHSPLENYEELRSCLHFAAVIRIYVGPTC